MNKEQKEVMCVNSTNVNYKKRIICLLELLDEDQDEHFLVQIYIMIQRHIY